MQIFQFTKKDDNQETDKNLLALEMPKIEESFSPLAHFSFLIKNVYRVQDILTGQSVGAS